MSINNAAMQLKPNLQQAIRQISTATWLQLRADVTRFTVELVDYHFKKGNVEMEVAVFYGENETPFELVNSRRHHVSLLEVAGGRLTWAEKSLLPLLLDQPAVRGHKLWSTLGNPCKTSLLLEMPDQFMLQLDAFLANVQRCQWAETTGRGTKMHVAL